MQPARTIEEGLLEARMKKSVEVSVLYDDLLCGELRADWAKEGPMQAEMVTVGTVVLRSDAAGGAVGEREE